MGEICDYFLKKYVRKTPIFKFFVKLLYFLRSQMGKKRGVFGLFWGDFGVILG